MAKAIPKSVTFALVPNDAGEDEELLSQIVEDEDYDGPPLRWTGAGRGAFDVSSKAEAEDLAVWLAGYHAMDFAELEFGGVNLLKALAARIREERGGDVGLSGELGEIVGRLLDVAVDENGYDELVGMPPLEVAEDLVAYSQELEDRDPEDLVPHVREWQRVRRSV